MASGGVFDLDRKKSRIALIERDSTLPNFWDDNVKAQGLLKEKTLLEQSLASWEKVKEQRRLELLDMLGLEPLPPRTPLNARITGVIDKPEYTIEKLAFESLPKKSATR